MFRRVLTFFSTSILVSGAAVGLGVAPAAAATGSLNDLRTGRQPCARDAPGPFFNPVRWGSAQAVPLEATLSGGSAAAGAEAHFEVWDVAHDESRQVWRRSIVEENQAFYVQLEDDSMRLDGVTYAWRARVAGGEETSAWTDVCYFTIDRDGGPAPVTASAEYPAGQGNQGGLGIPGRFTVTSTSGDTVRYSYRFTGREIESDQEWTMIDAPSLGAGVTIDFTPTAGGSHGLSVYAIDRAGNSSAVGSHQFEVRETRPSVLSADYPEDFANLDFTVGVPGEFRFDGVAEVTKFEWRIDEDGPSGSVDANPGTVKIAPAKGGQQTLYVRGVTADGTRYPERAYRFLVDDGPTVTAESAHPTVMGSTATFHATPRVPGVVAYVYRTFTDDGESPGVTVPAKADGSADIAFAVTDSEQDGVYVQSRTADGTLSVARRIMSEVDGAAPTTVRQGGDEVGGTATFVARTRMANVAEYRIKFGDAGTERTVPAAADGTAQFDYVPTRFGRHYFEIWAINKDGVRTDSDTFLWEIRTGPKVASAEFPPLADGIGRLAPGTLTLTPRLPVVTSYRYQINFGPVVTVPAQADGTATISFTPTTGGIYDLDVRSYNKNVSSDNTTYRFRVGPVPVKVTSVSPAQAMTGAVRTITVRGAGLHAKDLIQVTPAGRTAITATITSVSAQADATTADVNLTGAPAGAAELTVKPYGAAQPILKLPFTITPLPTLAATKRPTVSGTVAVGGVVKAAVGGWTPAPTAYRYQWAANGVAIKGATGSSLTVPAAVVGKRLTVTVTASRAGHPSGSAVSAATALVAKGKAPRLTRRPTVSGTAKVGRTLTANVGAWTPKPDSYRYEWRLGGKVIKGATARTLKLKSAWRNKTISVTVITKKAGYADARATSASVKVRR